MSSPCSTTSHVLTTFLTPKWKKHADDDGAWMRSRTTLVFDLGFGGRWQQASAATMISMIPQLILQILTMKSTTGIRHTMSHATTSSRLNKTLASQAVQKKDDIM